MVVAAADKASKRTGRGRAVRRNAFDLDKMSLS
jgi:hypothetical protein